MDITNMIPAGDDTMDSAEAADALHNSEFEKFITGFEGESDKTAAEEAIAYADKVNSEVVEDEDSGEPEEKVGETTGDVKAVKPEDTGVEKGLERLNAKEKEVKELRTSFEAERQKYLDEKKLFETEKRNLIQPQSLLEALDIDPKGTFEKLGVNSDRLMKVLLYNKLPDTNPAKAKLREELRDYDNRRETAQLREEIQSRDRIAAQKAEYEKNVTELNKYTETLKEDGEHVKELPTVSELAKSNLPYLQKRVLREVMEDARERYLRGETGDPLSNTEAVKRVESDLAELAKVFKVKPPVPNTNGSVEKKDTNTDVPLTRVKPATTTKVKKEVTIEDLEERALANAVAEFHKMENRGGFSGNK